MKLKNVLYLGIMLLLAACNAHQQETEPAVVADEESVTAFAQQIEQSVLNGNPDVYNNAFDREYLKTLIRDNSIVNSSLDADFGQDYFESNFHLGDEAVQTLNDGGDFKFVRYYLDTSDSSHHIVLRSYNDFMLNFYDFVVDTANGQLAIKDGFVYNSGCRFSDNLRENMLLNVLYKTNPEGITSTISHIKELSDQGKSAEAYAELQKHAAELSELSCYWQLYISNLYQRCPKAQFKDSLASLEAKGVDHRMILLHQLMFYLNEGMTEYCGGTINELIEYAGDDPIFLLIFGKANFYAKHYGTALGCYETANQYLPPLWDLWYGQLECFHALNDMDAFHRCLETGKKNYGMTDDELAEMMQNFR